LTKGFWHDATTVRSKQAVLWYNSGKGIPRLTERLQITRQTINNWLRMFHARDIQPIANRLQDARRSGRPPAQQQQIEAFIRRV
jgi:transposase